MLKAILFDYDDTLVQTKQCKFEAIKETGRRHYNLEITDEHILSFWGKPYQEAQCGVFSYVAPFEELHATYLKVTCEFPVIAYPHAVETLKTLVNQYQVGIVTASHSDLILDDLKRLEFPIEKMVDVQTSEDTSVYKPDPAVFDPILEKLAARSISPREVLYIGDSINDYIASRGAGLEFIGITHGHPSVFPEGTHLIKTMDELPDVVSST